MGRSNGTTEQVDKIVHDGKITATNVEDVDMYLPVDVVLEIVARSDITTVVRSTATSRILRSAILEPAFRGRLVAGAGGGGLDSALLLGVSIYSEEGAHRVIHTPSSSRVLLDPSILAGDSFKFEPAASRDGLLLYTGSKPNRHIKLLRVWDTSTGHATPLPQISLPALYFPVFLHVGGSSTYELLIADSRMRFQTFSSKHGQWAAVRQFSITQQHSGTCKYWLSCYSPAVVRRTVYWPCHRDNNSAYWDEAIAALDIDGAQGTIIEYPPLEKRIKDTDIMFASVSGFLVLLVEEKSTGISMWTFTPASAATQSIGTWSRHLLIDKVEIEKAVGLQVGYTFTVVGFGERSGSVIVLVGKDHLLRMDLGTKVIKRLHNYPDLINHFFFLHETDLVSLL